MTVVRHTPVWECQVPDRERQPPSAPDYGPAGYLPPRAARRARKIILRARMGLGWPAPAIGAAVLVAVTGVAFFILRAGPPDAPFQEVTAIEAVDPRGAAVAGDLLVVRAGGGVQVFTAPDVPVEYCAASGALEAEDGTVWNLSGRRISSTQGGSLAPVASQVHDGVLYADPTTTGSPPPGEDRGAVPAC